MGEYLAQVYWVAAFLLWVLLGVVNRRARVQTLDVDGSWGHGYACGVVQSVMVSVIVLAVCEVFGG